MVFGFFFQFLIKYIVDGNGFCVYYPDGTKTDLFEDDVFIGTLYTTEYNIEHNDGC